MWRMLLAFGLANAETGMQPTLFGLLGETEERCV